jgi:hypothetical protein
MSRIPVYLPLILALLSSSPSGQTAGGGHTIETLNKPRYSGHSPLAHPEGSCKTCINAPRIVAPPSIQAPLITGRTSVTAEWARYQRETCDVDARSLEGQKLSGQMDTLEKDLQPLLVSSWNGYLTDEKKRFGPGICQDKVNARQDALTKALKLLLEKRP